MKKIHYLTTGPFDWLNLYHPLDDITMKFLRHCCPESLHIVDRLLEATKAVSIGPLRERPVLIFLPSENGFEIVLLVKEDNNGTCHWFSESMAAMGCIEIMMGIQGG